MDVVWIKRDVLLFCSLLLLFWVPRDPGKVNNICNVYGVAITITPSAIIAYMESVWGRKRREKKVVFFLMSIIMHFEVI